MAELAMLLCLEKASPFSRWMALFGALFAMDGFFGFLSYFFLDAMIFSAISLGTGR